MMIQTEKLNETGVREMFLGGSYLLFNNLYIV